MRKAIYRFVHVFDILMHLCKKAFSFRPIAVSPHCCIYCKSSKCSVTNFSFYCGAYDKRPDTHCQFTEFYICLFYRNCIICCGCNAYAAAHTFSLYSCNDKFRTFPHIIYYMRKPTEKLLTFLRSLYLHKFIKRST